MLKSVFKEIAIVLLLILAILILLAVLFYDYMPSSKTVPAKVNTYELSQEVKVELEKELNNTNSEEIIKTYQLDAQDLEHYEKTKEYNKGKVNPFAEYSNGTSKNNSNSSSGNTNTNNVGNTNNSNPNNSSNSGSNSGSSSSGTFLNTVGK